MECIGNEKEPADTGKPTNIVDRVKALIIEDIFHLSIKTHT